MPKPKPKQGQEQKYVIDIFDRIITFSYAYEWQKSNGDGIDRLTELFDAVAAHIKNEGSDLISNEGIDEAVQRTLSMLSEVVDNGCCPEPVDFDDVWLNKPKKFDYRFLKEKSFQQVMPLMELAEQVIKSLNESLADELKPYVTMEQVNATFLKKYNEKRTGIELTIHTESFVDKIHEHYLGTYANNPDTSKNAEQLTELITRYNCDAENQFICLLQDNFITNSVIKFFTQAQNISLEIDRYYSWELIAGCHIDYNDLLELYSFANERDLVKDGHHKKNKYLFDDERMNDWLEWVLNNNETYRWFPYVKGTAAIRYLFDTRYDPVLIDGKPLQNHCVLALPYDKPLPDFSGKMYDFQKFFAESVEVYSRVYGSTVRDENQINNITKLLMSSKPYKRICLTNVGSVLEHICTLLCLQYERTGDNADKLKKLCSMEVLKLINNHGFIYSIETVESKRKSKQAEMLKTVKKLQVAYSENDMSKRTG